MNIYKIKKELEKKAVILHTGGKRPTNKIGESWIGSVRWKLKDEEIPLDSNERKMNSLATIFIKKNDYLPKDLEGISLITIFISDSFYHKNIDFDNLKNYFIIKTYATTENLVYCQWDNKYMKQFPLTEEYVNNDYPVWDNGGIPNNLFEIICEMENSNEIDYYYDIAEDFYHQHKVGGYPYFRQPGFWFHEEYNYVLQISSDEKANFNIIDNGNFYFYYNSKKNDWKVYCDFY